MPRIVVFMNLSLDGVMQAPGRPDEDVRGGFAYGGWAIPYADAAMGKVAAESMATTGALLFGRRTYEDFYSVWPHRKDNPFTEVLNNTRKYVESTTLKEPLPWGNSVLLKGDASNAVAELKARPGKDIVVLGSGALLKTLMAHNLIDEYVLQIHPLVLGSGSRLFNDGPLASLRLVGTTTTTTGVVIATYQPAEAISAQTTADAEPAVTSGRNTK
ncbi:MAG TPA: dihydrofolate reductase family protein [Candidatus Acidoferrum sp.]|nr:dihydrofolate reductase family protein [Candidatus Acidoferrum sp.]